MSLSDYAEKAALDHIFGPTPMTAPSARYVSLHSADPGETGTSELPVANGYARQAATFGAATLGTGVSLNSSAPVFTNTGSAWSAATHFAVWDAASGGNCLGIGPLTASKTVGAGDTATFAIGTLSATLA
jgi:hypothetical protein